MIYFRNECEKVRFGLNIYPPAAWEYSRGFVLDLGFFRWNLRYSPKLKKWYCSLYNWK